MSSKRTEYDSCQASGRDMVTRWFRYVVDERAANEVVRPSFVYRGVQTWFGWCGPSDEHRKPMRLV